jgi:hypothetical protein
LHYSLPLKLEQLSEGLATMIGTLRPALIVASLLILSHSASAAIIVDLTSEAASGSIGGAIYKQVDPRATGTGVINTFLRIQKTGIEEGFNTNYRPVEFDEKLGVHSRALLLSDVPQVLIDGQIYREFLLDLNESNSQPLISLTDVDIFLNNSAEVSTLASLGTPVYSMDAGGDASVKLDASLGSGSGSGDMLLFVPSSAFVSGRPYVYLYSKFEDASAGFEEWAAGKMAPGGGIVPITPSPAPVPEPAALSLLLAASAFLIRRTRR